jgi:hypothetical protein
MARRKFSGAKPRRARGTGPTMIQRSRSVSPAEKAAFHQIEGAGRSHVLREFFGLTPDDESAIVDRVAKALDQEVAR